VGNCKYCGKPAGLLRDKHKECEQHYLEQERAVQLAKEQVSAAISQAILDSGDFNGIEGKLATIEQTHQVPPSERRDLLIKGWETAVECILEDGVLDTTEEQRLVSFQKRFSLTSGDLNGNGALEKVVKAAVLRDILNGVLPQRLNMNSVIPVNLQKGEQIVWIFPESNYYEDKTRREYVGGSQGVSIRVMKGVYYRVGAFKGQAVEHTERVYIDTGSVVITNKHIYFAGPRKSLRVPYAKIVSFEPFSDGIGIMRDTTTAKPQVFETGDGWFTYNLVTNLSQL
jgi:hypothetical protein